VNTELDISRILNSFSRQKGIIIAVFVVVSALAAYLSAILPEVYRSSTLILVSPQKVPTSFVFSTVTTDLTERMQSITQEILSRTRLEKIVEEFGLYGDSKKISTMEDRVETLRRKINIEFRRNNIFQLSFESENPEKAKQVASRWPRYSSSRTCRYVSSKPLVRSRSSTLKRSGCEKNWNSRKRK